MTAVASYQWPISSSCGKDEIVSSPIFTFSGCEYCTWCLQYRNISTSFLCKAKIDLCLVSCHTFDIKCTVEVSCGEAKPIRKAEWTFTKAWEKLSFEDFRWNKSTELLTINVFLRHIEILKESPRSIEMDPKPPAANLSGDLLGLQDLYKDLTLSVGGNQLKVHKLIIAARSPVLAAMLTDGASLDKLVIPDLDFSVMERVVHFMYTDRVEDIETNAQILYPAACKYALSGLKTLCEESIEQCLTIENAAQTLVLVHQNSKDLKTRVINFMKNQFQAVTTTAGFKLLVLEHQPLSLEVFCAIHDVDVVVGAQAAA